MILTDVTVRQNPKDYQKLIIYFQSMLFEVHRIKVKEFRLKVTKIT